jgi:hypothetical protein
MGIWLRQPSNKQASCRVEGGGGGQADNRRGILQDRAGGGLAEKENKDNESRGAEALVTSSLSLSLSK